MLFSIDGVPEMSRGAFLENVSMDIALECLRETLPFFMHQSSIIDSQYKLNSLDLMELLIEVLSKDILIRKFKLSLKENLEKQKLEQGTKKNRKPVKNIRKKLPIK